MDTALETAERVREDHAEVWRTLSGLDRDDLQAVAVALAAMVTLDQPGILRWLQALPGGDRPSAASGLAMIVPA
ncbi:hypothetical protein [Mycolicibacterium tusciae]|uniref:hypothetical protein n=1 Tax=Mycolicibacterium tusciae TaxID=75922 RepID=UPI00024A230E|nr:hypothetical protein [Mycolicibacterium tusciae]